MTDAQTDAHADAHAHGRDDQLVKMANDIADFFKAQSDADAAINGIAGHMKNFWTRSMLSKLSAHVTAGAPELGDLPREALRRLNTGAVKPAPPAGGDAGCPRGDIQWMPSSGP